MFHISPAEIAQIREDEARPRTHPGCLGGDVLREDSDAVVLAPVAFSAADIELHLFAKTASSSEINHIAFRPSKKASAKSKKAGADLFRRLVGVSRGAKKFRIISTHGSILPPVLSVSDSAAAVLAAARSVYDNPAESTSKREIHLPCRPEGCRTFVATEIAQYGSRSRSAENGPP